MALDISQKHLQRGGQELISKHSEPLVQGSPAECDGTGCEMMVVERIVFSWVRSTCYALLLCMAAAVEATPHATFRGLYSEVLIFKQLLGAVPSVTLVKTYAGDVFSNFNRDDCENSKRIIPPLSLIAQA
eukprot:TRINITY_DN69_c0_g1_i9.p1 TRINITY_DN69_c0_g1~~TRINITY_DN69_c0_g1_i9.p1  ORF type:complete len:130 (+),score=3.52 TRINITY_DN69_c0_g1_i9:378-767(+)